MNPDISFLLSLLVVLPLAIGLIRLKKIKSDYRPFFWLIVLAVLTELFSFISIRLFRNNAVVSNVYYLLECMLILYQFYRWRFHAQPRKWYWVIPALFLLIWIIENLILFKIVLFSPVFRISYSFLLVVLSINEINYLITHENRHLFRNARFLICIAFIIYFLFQILFEGSLYIVTNPDVSNKIILLSIGINALANIFYAAAMWFLPENMFDFKKTMATLQTQTNPENADNPRQ
jgi:hypothetical protein